MTTTPLPDTETRGLLSMLPAAARPYALLARFDRPIGWWLLYWPCAYALALAGGLRAHWPLLAWMLLGAIAMRGAGCVYNDIVDRDLDARVARTRGRPLASGAVSLKAAWAWLIGLCLIGLVVLVQLNLAAALIAIASLALVAAYPFMKRITWWPQVWLGLVFSWGALVAWAAVTGSVSLAGLLLYGGCITWVIGYDTIYALQDVEDDALVGIKSSARDGQRGAPRRRALLCARDCRMGRRDLAGAARLGRAPRLAAGGGASCLADSDAEACGPSGPARQVPQQPQCRAARVSRLCRGRAGGVIR